MKSITDYINETKDSKSSVGIEIFNKYFADFDISNIPLSIRKKKVANCKTIYDFSNDVSEEYLIGDTDDIYESKESSKQVEATQIMLNELKRKYKMNDYNFLAYDPNNVCIVKIDNIPNYLQTTNLVLMPNVLKMQQY